MLTKIRNKIRSIEPFYKGIAFIIVGISLAINFFARQEFFLASELIGPAFLVGVGLKLLFPYQWNSIETGMLALGVVIFGYTLFDMRPDFLMNHLLILIWITMLLIKNIALKLRVIGQTQEKKYDFGILFILLLISLYDFPKRVYAPGGLFELLPTLLFLFLLWRSIQSGVLAFRCK